MKNQPQNVRLIFGQDDFQAQQAVNTVLLEWAPPEQRALSLESFDGAQDTVQEVGRVLDQCLEGLLTPAFFGQRKTVWLRDAAFLDKNAIMGNQTVKERLRLLADWIAKSGHDCADVRFLISACGIDKRTAFYLACKKSAAIQEFSVPKSNFQAQQYARRQLTELLRQAGLRASPTVMDELVARTGVDTRQIASEVEKLKVYLGSRKIVDAADIHDLVPHSRQSAVWDFTDTIAAKNLPLALTNLRRLLFQKHAPVRLLAILERLVRDLIVYRHAVDCRWIRRADTHGNTIAWNKVPPDVEKVFSAYMDRDPRVANPYRMAILAKTAARFRMDHLLHWRALIVNTYRRLFSGGVPPEIIMELLLIQMLGNRAVTACSVNH